MLIGSDTSLANPPQRLITVSFHAVAVTFHKYYTASGADA